MPKWSSSWVARLSWLAAALMALAASPAVQGQCGPRWLTSTEQGIAGVNIEARCAFSYDRDGNGPAAPQLLIGGAFYTAGNVRAQNLASFDGAAWSEFGGGCNGSVRAMVIHNGKLVVAGNFTRAGDGIGAGVFAFSVARWDEELQRWQAYPFGCPSDIRAMVVWNGQLVVAGSGGVVARLSADGTTWQQLGPTFTAQLWSMAVYGGELYVGGAFHTSGPSATAAHGIARWDGTAWRPLGSNTVIFATSLAVYGGELYAGGNVVNFNGETGQRIARWNGTTWRTVGATFDAAVDALVAREDGVYAFGRFLNVGGVPAAHAARWDGASWTPLGSGLKAHPGADLYAAGVHNGEVVVTGAVTGAGDLGCDGVAGWTGTAWRTYGNGIGGFPVAGSTVWNNRLVLVGGFASADGRVAAGVALWDGTTGGMTGMPRQLTYIPPYAPSVGQAAVFRGDLIVGGYLAAGGGEAPCGVARWTGSAWAALGGGVNSPVSLLYEHDGDLIVGGPFTAVGANADVPANMIARWDGAEWHSLGAGLGGTPLCATTYNGDLIVGGVFVSAGGQSAHRVARWDGSAWHTMQGLPGSASVYALRVYNNELWAAGTHFVARWDGATWQLVTPGAVGDVYAMAEYRGDLYFAGSGNAAATAYNGFARWTGSGWEPLGTGIDGSSGGTATTLSVFNDELVAGGEFASVGGFPANAFVRWTRGGVEPAFALQPADVAVSCGDHAPVTFGVTASPGYGALSYRWRRGAVELSDGPVAGGGVVSGATTHTLTLSGPMTAFGGEYSCVVTGPCGAAVTRAATLTVSGADIGSAGGVEGTDGALDNNDFIVFIDWFFTGDTRADRGRAGGEHGSDGRLDNNDFIVFIDEFFAAGTGC